MGNRATVIFSSADEKEISPAVYLHWNGGPESIYAFLDELDRRKVKADQMYGCARFIHIVGDFMDKDSITGLSLGVTNGPKKITIEELSKVKTDHGNNGFYIVYRGKNGDRKMRRFICTYDDPDSRPLKELTQKEVDDERVLAYKNDYIIGGNSIPNTFIELQGKRKID